MKKLVLQVAVALWAGTVGSQATVFDYSYTFGSTGDVFSGTLEGDQSGDFINNVANVTLLFNGTSLLGPIYTARWQTGSPSYVAGPIVSFDVHKNDFVFVNSDIANGDASRTEFLQVINGGVYPFDLANAESAGDSTLVSDNGSFGRWSLTARPDQPTGLPDGGSTAVMLGLAIGALNFIKRKG